MGKKLSTIWQSLALLGFVLTALASTSAKDTINSKEFREGFERGWEFGRSLRSDATLDIQYLDSDSIDFSHPDVAQVSYSKIEQN